MVIFSRQSSLLASPLIIAALAFSTTAKAEQPMPDPAKDYRAMIGAEIGQELRSYSEQRDACSDRVPLLEEAKRRRPDVPELDWLLFQARSDCAVNREAFDEALVLLDEWQTANARVFGNFGLYVAARAGDAAAGLKQLELVLLSGNEQGIKDLQADLVWSVFQMAGSEGLGAETERISNAAIEAGAIEHVDPRLKSTFASSALGSVMSSGDLSQAKFLLEYIGAPTLYVKYLGERRYEAIWPLVEERVGENYRKITSEFLSNSRAAYDPEGEDKQSLNDYAHALYFHGDFEGVIALVDKHVMRPDLETTIVEDEGWTLNLKAYALDALGRKADADGVFDYLGFNEKIKEPWVVNFIINRGSRLVGQGRWEEGLEAAQAANAFAQDNGSPYARALTLRDQICAHNALGQADPVPGLLDQLKTEAEQTPILIAEAMLCLDRDEEAVELLISGLKDEQRRGLLIENLQSVAFDMFYTRTILRQPRSLLADHPALQEEFLRHARLIPEEYYPAASLAR